MFSFFFFNDTATTEIYTLSLHDALPISVGVPRRRVPGGEREHAGRPGGAGGGARAHRSDPGRHRHRVVPARPGDAARSEEHTSELQSLAYLVCRLLLEKKKNRELMRCP